MLAYFFQTLAAFLSHTGTTLKRNAPIGIFFQLRGEKESKKEKS